MAPPRRDPLAKFPRIAVGFSALLAAGLVTAPAALASTTHVVQPSETLSGIAAANGLTTESLAAWNGLAADHLVISGSSIIVPTVEEAGTGSAASSDGSVSVGNHVVADGETLGSIAAANAVSVDELAAANGIADPNLLIEGVSLTIPASSGTTSSSGLGAIWSPWGDLYLDPAAALAWNSMRDRSLADYGVDLYPQGTLSAYRTYEQQAELYDLFLSGVGAPASPPGSSSHELGISVDLATEEMRYVVDQIGWEYGWGKLEAPDEWWHVSYGG